MTGLSLIAVVMKAPTSAIRFQNASSLLDYGFSNFEYKPLIEKGNIVNSVRVNKGIQPTVNILAESTLGTIIGKGNDVAIEQEISIEPNLTAPISQGQVIGKISFKLNSQIIAECNLIAENNINKANFLITNGLLFQKWFSLLRTA